MEEQNQGKTLEFNIHFRKGRNGCNQLRIGDAPEPSDLPVGRVPRITRLLALAIKLDGMIECGEAKDYAELAVLGHVSRARITQIMGLLQLAPDIQEKILFLNPVREGREPIRMKHIAPIAKLACWKEQRTAWRRLAL